MTAETVKDEPHFFDYAAEVGLTKHFGGLDATDEIIELCGIGEGSYVIDVGCGAGTTACYMARRHGCSVVGVDIVEMMVERSRERARKEGVADLTEFRVADAQDLPFEDGIFDAVITESVTVFPKDKQRAVREYARVTGPGGYIGLNESTWLKTPPPPELISWASQDTGATVEPLTRDDWVGLLEGAGLTHVFSRVSGLDMKGETRGLVRRYGYLGMLNSVVRGIFLYMRSPEYRGFVKRVKEEGVVPENLDEYFGYGIYIGKKY